MLFRSSAWNSFHPPIKQAKYRKQGAHNAGDVR
jgi:hypothetical protein